MAYKEILGVTEREVDGESKSFWTRIGVAFQNKDGSWNCRFDYIPIDSATTIQIRDPKPREPREEF